MTDLKQAVEAIICTARDYTTGEVYTATRYDPRTGKPTKYAWKPEGKFRPEAYVKTCDMLGINYDDEIKLSPAVTKTLLAKGLRKEPLLIDTKYGPHVLTYEIDELDREGARYTEHYIRIKKHKPLRNIDDVIGKE